MMKTQTQTQWQLYKSLELIPDSVPEPQANPWGIKQMTYLWRSIVDALSGKEAEALQMDYLERCLALDLNADDSGLLAIWHQCWESLNRSLSVWDCSTTTEPKVWQSVDNFGQTWWHIYNPRTGEQADLSSEDEVCTWIEQSFYR